ncbi:MAG: peptidase [Clostridiales bacterium]|jgi:hypothetical protein|nr:peptidase [Clostridiales bacterium]
MSRKFILTLTFILIFAFSTQAFAAPVTNPLDLSRIKKNLGLDESSTIDFSFIQTYYETPDNFHTNVYVDEENPNETFHNDINIDLMDWYVGMSEQAAMVMFDSPNNIKYSYYLYGEFDNNIGVHEGVDMKYTADSDRDIRAISKGEVIAVGGSYGKIAIYDSTENVTTFYLHCSQIDVTVGDTVNAGDIIGEQGSVGASGAHVHFEVRAGKKTSPNTGTDLDLLSEEPYGYFLLN